MAAQYPSLHLIHFFFFFGQVSLCSLDYPRTPYVDQVCLELTEIYVPLPPDCWDLRCVPLGLATLYLFKKIYLFYVMHLPEHMHAYAGIAHKGQKRPSDLPGIRVQDGCEPLCGCCELNRGPLQG